MRRLKKKTLRKILRRRHPFHVRLKSGQSVIVQTDGIFLPIPPPEHPFELALHETRLNDAQVRDIELSLLRDRIKAGEPLDTASVRELEALLDRAPFPKTGS